MGSSWILSCGASRASHRRQLQQTAASSLRLNGSSSKASAQSQKAYCSSNTQRSEARPPNRRTRYASLWLAAFLQSYAVHVQYLRRKTKAVMNSMSSQRMPSLLVTLETQVSSFS